MYKSLAAIILFFITSFTNAQIHEMGVIVGASNFIGDVGATNYIKPKNIGFGFQYRWNRSPRHSWRANYTMIPVEGMDSESDMGYRKLRNYSFKNTLHEVALGLEFNFFKFDQHNTWFAFTPYLYTGLAAFDYKNSYFEKNSQVFSEDKKYALAIPVAVGFKALLNRRFVISGEVGTRYAFTDNIDGNNPTTGNSPKFGNTNSNDWYVFSALTLTYTFGKNPCYCTPTNF